MISRHQPVNTTERNIASKFYFFIILLLVSSCLMAKERLQIKSSSFATLATSVTMSAPATVISDAIATISAQIQGEIITIAPAVGTKVAEGELLAEMDCRSYDNRYKQAQEEYQAIKVQRDFADGRLSRAINLTKTITTEELEQRKMNLALLQAQLRTSLFASKQAELDFSKCRIVAPFDGVVVKRIASVGDFAAPAMAILQLLRDNSALVEAQVVPEQIDDLLQATNITFVHADESVPVTVQVAIPQVNSASRNQMVRLAFTDQSAVVGLSGRIYWKTPNSYLDPKYIVRRNGELGVMTTSLGKAIFVPIKGAQEGRPARVTLPATMRIITDGLLSLADGDLVQE